MDAILWTQPDRCTLIIQDLIRKDEALYSCSAINVAGPASTSCMLHVVDEEKVYHWRNYLHPGKVPIKPRHITDLYDLGDEIGRGTQGVIYHAVERSTGESFLLRDMSTSAINVAGPASTSCMLHVVDEEKVYHWRNYLHPGKVPIKPRHITDLYDLGDEIGRGTQGVIYHAVERSTGEPGDILISRKGGIEVRISDFGLAKRVLAPSQGVDQRFGMPDFAAPETVTGGKSGVYSDMWSLGVITYLLLSGISPFRGRDDVETMDKIKSKLISFEGGAFDSLSADAKDFLRKLLKWEIDERMSCKEALKHSWIHTKFTKLDVSIRTDHHREYIHHYRDWYANASCRTYFRRRPLEGAYTDPSRMVYPPGMNFTPLSSPERTILPSTSSHKKRFFGDDEGRVTDLIENDQEIPDSNSMYQNGPDTYLLQLRDVNFPSRLRRYMQVASSRSPMFALKLRQDPWIGSVTVKERRRFQDLNDEEIDDERRGQKMRGCGILLDNNNGSSVIPRRIRLEVGCGMGDLKKEAELFSEQKWDGHMPFFREKLQATSLADDSNADLTCLAVGEPTPIIQWFKNDMMILSGKRISIQEDDHGRSFLRFRPANKEDTGVYKVVARNKHGQTVCKGRLLVAHRPGVMEGPLPGEISDTEIVLKWDLPLDDGNSPIICYGLQYRQADQVEWQEVAMNIDHEFFCMRNLIPVTSYEFRLLAQNAFGWSPPGLTSGIFTTKAEGAPKVKVSRAMKHLQLLTEKGFEIEDENKRPPLDYSIEENPVPFSEGDPKEKYHFIAELDRGRFSVIVKAFEPVKEQFFVAKVISTEGLDKLEWAQREYFHLSRLRHERLAIMHEAYRLDKGLVLMLDKLQGYDVLTFLSQKPEYTEELVANIVKQADQLKPLRVVQWSVPNGQETLGSLEYMAPEVLSKEDITPQADVWSIGVLAYILLSGVSPFRGATDQETRTNINFARYRFEHLYREITQEASRFLMLIFKRHAVKRPDVEECLEHRWLQCTEYMIKKRERAVFNSKQLKVNIS
ncbi:unnamed protein product [Notodromas monacha]|uniref:Uncharacterized protein n=1 Tax=Notodromas monacha TaxID=399045 RepID=A0A7R9GDK8_9CRUS|nr:unnamed protein product [Notodromas monacha]CAG0918788.1 unnamed protein product [Notodromas monacha]